MIKNAAIIELGSSHEECFYSQILFLEKDGWNIHLLCSSVLKQRIENLNVKKVFFDLGKNVYSDILNLIRLRKILINKNITKVIFNSAHGILVRNFLLLPFPKKIEFTGIIHDAGKILNSSNQKFINKKVKKYFVLSDYVLHYVRSLKMKDITFESFYPIFQPEYSTALINKTHNEFWICVPGRIEQKRRDYKSLLQNLIKTKLSGKVKIILLGRIDEKFKDELKISLEKLNLNHQFILFEKFIPNEIFYSYLQLSNLILPLIHPTDIWFDKYSKTQISGSYNMAYTYKIPMLSENSFSAYEDFKDTSFFYETENLVDRINCIAGNKEFYLSAKNKMYMLSKWSYEFQSKKFVEFLESKNLKIKKPENGSGF